MEGPRAVVIARPGLGPVESRTASAPLDAVASMPAGLHYPPSATRLMCRLTPTALQLSQSTPLSPHLIMGAGTAPDPIPSSSASPCLTGVQRTFQKAAFLQLFYPRKPAASAPSHLKGVLSMDMGP